nr:hypothetical protein B0A51_05153 [Rachicladosporium sp. CCFEE 5018]OQO28600.1 hypothetical protein B0A51_05419 [Rachicladosporium sp. CCFEE 5018]
MAQYPPGMNVQPGFPHGHPGMAPGPNQHMGPQIQMHPGMSGPPQVSQASAMMGMQPGAVGGMPGANGMTVAGMGGQHPGAGMAMPGQNMAGPQGNMQASMAQQQFMMQQQQQHQQQMLQNNPQVMQQLQQRNAMMQQRAQQLSMTQQQLQSLNPAQMSSLFSNQAAFLNNAAAQQQQQQPPGTIQLPDHLRQQQMATTLRAHQTQAQQSQLLAQQQAMQHVNSQHSNQSQQSGPHPQAQPGQPGPQGQPVHPGQMRPQSRMANPNEQGQQQQMQQQQGPPQHSQQPQQHQPTPPQANAQQGQQAMTPQQQQQIQQQQQVQQQQMAQAHMARQNFMLQRKLQMEAQRTTAAAQQSQMQQVQQAQQHLAGGQYILRLLLFADKLGSFSATDGEQDGRELDRWQRFIDQQFADDGRLALQLYDQPSKQIEIPRAVLGRYFWMYFETGASSLRLHTENAKEVKLQDGTGRCRLSCSNATLTVSYPNGARIDLSGPLVVMFGSGITQPAQIEAMEFKMDRCEEHMNRTEVEKVLLNLSPTMSNQKSPKMTKNKLPKAQQKLQQQQQGEGLTIESFPKAPKSQSGMSVRMLQFLEISETMNMMQELVTFAAEHRLPAATALDQLNTKYDSDPLPPQQQQQLPPHLMPNGLQAGTPQMRQPPPSGFGSSPALNHMPLPNGVTSSPHMGQTLNLPLGLQPANMSSPNSGAMAAPPMLPQHSQQGTNSSAASANTSPMVSNKRRRSQVKMEEGDGGGGEGKVKPSPRMGKKGKPS